MGWLHRYGAVIVVTLSCSSSVEHGVVRAGPGTGSGGNLGMGDPRGRGIAVSVVFGTNTVCPGQCTDARAEVEGAGAYQYAWTPELPPNAGPHTLCPSETTRVEVKVTAGGGEFTRAGVASATLHVSDACEDGGVPGAGGRTGVGGGASAGGAPRGAGGKATEPEDAGAGGAPAEWPIQEPTCVTHLVSVGGAQVIDLGGDDSAYAAGMFKGTLTAGTKTLTSSAVTGDGFVVRLDAACNVVWAKSLPGASRTLVYQVASASDGHVIVVGSFDGFADFGAGLMLSGPFRNVFVAKLDHGDGHTIWSRQYQTTETPGSNQGFTSLAVASNGDIAFTGFGNRATDFGGGALAAAATPAQLPYVAKLDSTGGHRFSRPLPFDDVSSALGPDGKMSIAGLGYGTFTWGARTVGSTGVVTDVVAELDATGAALGISERPGSIEGWQTTDASEQLAAGPDGTLYRAEGRLMPPEAYGFAVAVWAPGATVPVLGPVTFQFPVGTAYDFVHRLSASSRGSVFAASNYGTDFPVAGRKLITTGARDSLVLQIDRTGAVLWGGHYGTVEDEWQIHVHAAPSGGVFTAGYEGAGASMFVARFASAF